MTGEVSSLDKVRLFMDAAEGTEFDFKTLCELAGKRELSDVCTPEALDLIEPAKAWAVLVAEGFVPMDRFLDKPSREHVHAVAEAAYDEIDSRRPNEHWLAKENEAQDEEADWRLGLDAGGDDPVYLDTEYVDE